MKKEFVPYELALELKKLGFDEPCLGAYYQKELRIVHLESKPTQLDYIILAPLYQQAFRWFREKFGFYYTIWPEFYKNGINFNWQIRWYLPKDKWTKYVISDGTMQYGDNGEYPSQENAQLACLKKLIEIVKTK